MSKKPTAAQQKRTSARYYKNHTKKIRVWCLAWRKANPQHALKRFGLNAAGYAAILTSQGGVCAICGSPETCKNPKTGKVTRLAVDHDHANGQNRGLLCRKCNQVLGLFKDNPAIFRVAAAYLEDWRVSHALAS